MLTALHITKPILDVIIAAFLVYISYYDVKYLKIKNKVLLMLLPFTAARGAAAAALEILENGSGTLQTVCNQILGGLGPFLVFLLVAVIMPGAIGGGDIKLIGVIGIALGWQQMLMAVLVGAVLNLVYWLVKLVIKAVKNGGKVSTVMLTQALVMSSAFGPFLSAGFLTAELLLDYHLFGIF